MEDLPYDHLLQDVLKDALEALNVYRGHPKLLELISRPVNNAPNMFFLAIQNRRYSSAFRMLEIFVENEEDSSVSKVLLCNYAGENGCLPILIWNYVNPSPMTSDVATKSQTNEIQQKEREKILEILNNLKQFKCFTQLATDKRNSGDTTIVWAIKNNAADIAKHLLELLQPSLQLDVIKRRERCATATDCRENKHDETCKQGYNALMLALDAKNVHGPLIDHILNIVSQYGDEVTKSEIAMGKSKPEALSAIENSLHLAAKKGQEQFAKNLLLKCVPCKHWVEAFLEIGLDGKSVKDYVSEEDDMAILEEFKKPCHDATELLAMGQRLENMKEDPTKYNYSDAQKEHLYKRAQELMEKKLPPLIDDLKKSLQDPAKLKNFLRQEMSHRAIEFFYNAGLFQNRFLIPKPSERSQPMALIFQNTNFTTSSTLEYAAHEADCMVEALKYLGWEDDMITLEGQWTYAQLTETLKKKISQKKSVCSFLFLCITSHGCAGSVCGCDETEGRIINIINVITKRIPKHIPKALIFDLCRLDNSLVGNTQEQLQDNNILLLSATVYKSTAKQLQYLPELAKQLRGANGRTLLQDMHIVAAAKINKSTKQIPHIEMTGMSICLQRYDKMDFCCQLCEINIVDRFRDCLICDCCHHWYHLECLVLEKRHKDLCSDSTFLWFCETCYNKWREV